MPSTNFQLSIEITANSINKCYFKVVIYVFLGGEGGVALWLLALGDKETSGVPVSFF
jgi:hypothetical protein